IHVVRDQTEHLAYAVGGHRSGAERHDLIENRQAVAHPAVRALGDQVEGLVGGLESFRRHDLAQALDDGSRADAPEVEALQPGQVQMRVHESHAPHGSPPTPLDARRSQFNAIARMRAAVVFPTPRGPANRYPWATRPPATAPRSAAATWSWTSRSESFLGRYLRARAIMAQEGRSSMQNVQWGMLNVEIAGFRPSFDIQHSTLDF